MGWKKIEVNEAKKMSGIKTIVWLDSLDGLLQPWIHLADNIYLETNENDRKANLVRTRDYRFIDEMKSRYPLHNYERAAKIMKELRGIKTALEIEVLQKAIDITDNTFRRLLKFIKPGVMEYEIEAEIFHSFLKSTGNRSGLWKYYCQWRQGKNTCIMFPITRNVKMAN